MKNTDNNHINFTTLIKEYGFAGITFILGLAVFAYEVSQIFL